MSDADDRDEESTPLETLPVPSHLWGPVNAAFQAMCRQADLPKGYQKVSFDRQSGSFVIHEWPEAEPEPKPVEPDLIPSKGKGKKKASAVVASLALILLSACAPEIAVYKMGNEYVQDAHSRNLWTPNWQRVTYCWKLENGFCPKEDTRVETASSIAMDSPGRSMATGFVSNVPLGLGLGLGLAYQNVGRMTQSATSGLSQNTVFESPGTIIK